MENTESQLGEWAEDVCEVCGDHLGYGFRLFHLGRCDEHSDESEDFENTPATVH